MLRFEYVHRDHDIRLVDGLDNGKALTGQIVVFYFNACAQGQCAFHVFVETVASLHPYGILALHKRAKKF
jgi:hypothetical protein